MAVLGAVHRLGPPLHPLRETQRHEVVHHRRAHAGALRRVHPVGEVEHVERSQEALGRRPLRAAPGRAPAVRERQEADLQLDVDPRERLGNRLFPARARRRERDDLVPPAGRLDEPRERAADVVADPAQRMRQRRDVEGDPHGTVAEAEEMDPERRAGRRDPGTRVGRTVKHGAAVPERHDQRRLLARRDAVDMPVGRHELRRREEGRVAEHRRGHRAAVADVARVDDARPRPRVVRIEAGHRRHRPQRPVRAGTARRRAPCPPRRPSRSARATSRRAHSGGGRACRRLGSARCAGRSSPASRAGRRGSPRPCRGPGRRCG